MTVSILAMAAVFVAAPLPQQAPVSGLVVDAVSGEPVQGASASLGGAGTVGRSDEEGRFEVSPRPGVVDTLLVTHPDYAPGRVVLGDLREVPPVLAIALEPRATELAPDAAALAAARAMAERTGGSLWVRDDFQAFVSRAGHPLDLLFFSGLGGHTSDRADCVTLRGGAGCAVVQVGDPPDPNATLSGRAPAEVEAFVVVSPSSPSLEDAAAVQGLVAVFLRSDGR